MGAFDDLIPQKGGAFSDLVPAKEPKKEKSIGNWLADTFGPNGNLRGSAIGGAMQGAADFGIGAAQLVSRAADSVPVLGHIKAAADYVSGSNTKAFDKHISEKEKEYQSARAAAGRDGFDAARMAGNAAITLPLGGAAPAVSGFWARLGTGAAQGGAMAALNPVTNGGENFWSDKGQEVMSGAAGGTVLAPVAGALGRIISPNASKNADVRLLQQEGVPLTVGQSLGGNLNRIEERLQSVPVLGDAIGAARNRAREAFNKAAINRAVAPIGEHVDDVGQTGVKEAGDMLSRAYEAAKDRLNFVQFDNRFANDLSQLETMLSGLEPKFRKKFQSVLDDQIYTRLSPNGSMIGDAFKKVQSDIGKESAAMMGLERAAARDYGSALKQLDSLLNQQVVRGGNQEAAALMKAADEGWANLVRVEGAATAAKNSGGVFTPGQLNQAVRHADHSVRDRATARGTALMQDLGNAGQNVIGNRVANSGTPERMWLTGGLGAIATGAINPAIPLSVLGGAASYAPAIQNMLVKAITKRPDMADDVANALRQYLPIAGGSLALGLNQ